MVGKSPILLDMVSPQPFKITRMAYKGPSQDRFVSGVVWVWINMRRQLSIFPGEAPTWWSPPSFTAPGQSCAAAAVVG